MPLNRLIKAKKSVSDIFSRMSGAPIQPCSPKRNENDAPSCETVGPYSPRASSAVPDASDESPTKDISSVRKGLMGSLRKQKLRSISSLRSLRSPTKAKQSDTPASPLAEGPDTPKHRLNSSLVIDLEESPMFDLDRKDSSTSSLKVHHSSPVSVPASEKQPLQPFVDLSLIPFGTVPLSPAPIQKILELDQIGTPPSPTSNLAYNPGSETMRRSASTKSALFGSLQGAAVYFDEPVVSYDDLEVNDLLPDECFTQPDKRQELRQKLACEEPSWVSRIENSSDHMIDDKQDSERGSATNKAPDAANANKTAEEHAKLILGRGYYARAYHRGDGKCRLKIKLLASDSEDGDDEPKCGNKTPFRLTGAQEDRLVSELGAILRENGMISTTDDKIDEAFAAGELPEFLDIALDGDNSKNMQSLLHNPTEIRKRDSTWGQHTGLYDGSGYGAGSSSRPVTGATETTDVPPTRVPETFPDHENEAPTIIRRLWDSTHPHGLDTSFPRPATVGDAAISEAQEQPESYFKDYEAFQGMLGPRGNA